MKIITNLLFMLVMLVSLQGCSDNDEPKDINSDSISGEWYITGIKGWEYDNDAPNGKYEFEETFNFNSQGIPVGSNTIDAQKVIFTENSYDSETGVYYYSVTSYYWSISSRNWVRGETGNVKLQGNQLIDGTMRATITKMAETSMTIYQKDSDGEYYITYTRL